MAACLACGNELPGEFPFCPFCAAPLSAGAPAPLVEERKVVSVLFCDLVGFTAASEIADPEDVRARLQPYHTRVREEIERYGGTVEKFVGDAVMAVFGAPVAHEDDAERAVRAGFRILESIDELNKLDSGLRLQVRIGINTGEAVVALHARPERGEGIVTGDVVNTAARVEAAAPVGGIAVAERTFRETERVFVFERLDPVEVKGKLKPLTLWRPLEARARFGADVTRSHAAPLVGRELDKSLLIGSFERAVQQRSVQLVTIVGEAGVGKSRLVVELLAYVDARPGLTRWRQGRCLPYGTGITFWALGEIVKAEAGILESDSAQMATAKLETAVPDGVERTWLLQRLLPLVGVEAASLGEREELFTAWRRYLEGLAASRPTVLVFEDLHWADDALLSFLEYLGAWAEGLPLLLVCTARPELLERGVGWGAGQRNSTTITLQPLSEADTEELVRSLVMSRLAPELEKAIVDNAGGNPLYAEEFVRLLQDRGPAGDGAELPGSVQALIAARLDTLPPERKSLLQDAAVLGKVFWARALAEMGDRDESDVQLALHELARKELVRPVRASSMAGEDEYAFWHLLLRDVAYSQIPRGERVRRHLAAAGWIEEKAAERVEDLAEVLAQHYVQALELAEASGDTATARSSAPSARRFLALAADRALGLDPSQARARLQQALDLSAEDDADRPDLLVRWAEATFEAGQFTEAADAAEQALTASRERGDPVAVGRTLILLSLIKHRLGEPGPLEFVEEAVAVLEQHGAGPALVDAYTQLARVRIGAGLGAVAAIDAADRALSLAESFGLPVPALALGFRGHARGVLLGRQDGVTELRQAIGLLVERGDTRRAARLMTNLGMARWLLEGLQAAFDTYTEAIALCTERGLESVRATLDSNRVELLIGLGRTQEGLELLRRLIPAAEERGDAYNLVTLQSLELAAQTTRGEGQSPDLVGGLVAAARESSSIDHVITTLVYAAATKVTDAPADARALLAEVAATANARENQNYPTLLPLMMRTAIAAGDTDLAATLPGGVEQTFPFHQHTLASARAILAEARGDIGTAANLYADAARRWREFGNVPERAYALLGQGRCLLALGDADAEVPLAEARDLFESMGYRPALTETEKLLAETVANTA